MPIDLVSDIGHHVPAGHVGGVAPDEAHHCPDDVDPQRQQRQPCDQAHGIRARLRVCDCRDHRPDQPRPDELDGHESQHADHC